MLPLILGIGVAALISEIFSDDETDLRRKGKLKKTSRSYKKKIFISFAFEDRRYRDFLVAQAKNEKSPFAFIDMSVKEPWMDKVWKIKCREKIQKCDGVIVLLSKNTRHSGGSRWEIKCAIEEGVPVVGMHINKVNKSTVPPELNGKKVIDWTWGNLEKSINKF